MGKEARKANFADYFLLQGGKPHVYQDNYGNWHYLHEYKKGAKEVVTRFSPEDRGTVFYLVNGECVEFEVAYLWVLEGEPCERGSRKRGGSGYKRTR